MDTTKRAIAGLLAALILGGAVLAQYDTPGTGAPPEQWISGYLQRNLLRSPFLTAPQSAAFDAAEAHARRGETAQAIARLDAVLQTTAEADVLSVTRLNIATLARRAGDVDRAIREYRQVAGQWESYAQRELLAVLETAGRWQEAAALLQVRLVQSQEPGEQLMLLRRLAALYTRYGQEADALATYARIREQFTPEQMARLAQTAAAAAQDAMDRAIAAAQDGRFDDSDSLVNNLRLRIAALSADGRTDEARAMSAVLQRNAVRFTRSRRPSAASAPRREAMRLQPPPTDFFRPPDQPPDTPATGTPRTVTGPVPRTIRGPLPETIYGMPGGTLTDPPPGTLPLPPPGTSTDRPPTEPPTEP